MSVTYGFYNSLNGDRRYNAMQMSSIFDGIIVDGVFASIGTAFAVKATSGLIVHVGIGRAWFNHTWTYNDSILPLEAPEAELVHNRIDAVVLEINASESVRKNEIKFIKGEPAAEPVNPTLTNDELVHQYPLCYIYRKAGSTEITQAEITNMIGTEQVPFVTGILQTISLDELLGQWQAQLDQFVEKESKEMDEAVEQIKTDLLNEQAFLDQWIDSEQADFLAWYGEMKDKLGEDAAGNLQLQIDEEEVKRILLVGFVDGTKEFSDDGKVITATAVDGRKLIKTFSDDFSSVATVLKSAAGADVAEMVKAFDPNGKLITTNVTYYP